MTPKITLCYITSRLTPQWQWFVDSICAQTTPEQRDNIQFVFIDGYCWHVGAMGILFDTDHAEIELADPEIHHAARREELARVVNRRFDYLHIPPKPCAWQGPFRQTKDHWFCAGNTRNTGVVVARNPYLVFVDDLSVLMPGWFNQVLHAAQDQYVVCGAYKKVKQLKVSNGFVEHYEEFPAGVDTRWPRGSDGGVVKWYGTGLFGCSFGVPLEAMLEVDGNDRATDGAGAEDYDLGMRLDRAGWAFFYNRNMLTLESEEHHHDGSKLPQARKPVTPDRLPRGYESYQHVNPTERHMSDHVMLNRLCNETDRILPILGDDLRVLREHFLRTGLVPIPRAPQFDWRDGTPLSEL
jgi:hypothetical protein